jgi:peptide/nickel transport system substrate-binding protein
MLRAEGLKVKLEEVDGKTYRNKLKKGEYDLYLGQTKLSPNMDLSAFFASKGSLSFGGIANASMLTACWDALANSGNYYTLHQKVMEDGCLVPILFRSYAVYSQRGVFDSLAPTRDNIFFYTIGKTMESIM